MGRRIGILLVALVVPLLATGCGSRSPGTATAVPIQTIQSTVLITRTSTLATTTVDRSTVITTMESTVPTTVPVTRTATVAVTVTATAQPSSTTGASSTDIPSSAAAPSWPADTGAIGVAPSPAFPASLPGFKKDTAWTVTVRSFTGKVLPVEGANGGRFPSTMNGCSLQRFLVRWRSVASGPIIKAGSVDAAGQPGRSVTGSAGWMDVDSCQTPTLEMVGRPGAGTIADVAVDVQQWVVSGG